MDKGGIRMRKYWMCVLVLLMCICGFAWADNSEEIAVITEMADAMNRFADRLEEIDDPEDFISATTEYAETIDRIGKDMVAVMEEHPEWGEDPPPDVAEPLRAYMEAAGRYVEAESKVTRYANDHPDHQGCQEAMKRFARAVYEMYQ